MWLFSRLFWPIHLRMPIDKDSVHDDASGEPGTLLAERERMHGMLQRQSGTFLEMAGRSAMVGSWVVDLPTRRFLWSDEVAAIYGMPASPMHEFDDAVGLFRSRWRDIFINRFEACARDGTPFDEEMEIVSAQGRNRWVRVMGQAVRDGQGAIVGVHGATHDVTARKKTQARAHWLETRLTHTLERLTDAFFMLDPEWRFTYMNHECEKLVGRPREELTGQPVWDEFRKAITPKIIELPEDSPDGRTLVELQQFRAPDGLWFEVRAYPSEDGLAVYMRDITQHRASQEQLKLLELSVSRLNDLVLITEAGEGGPSDQRLVFVNDAFVRHTGYTRDEVLGQSPRLLQGTRTQRAELDRIAAALKDGTPVRAEIINYRKHGEEFWIELDMVPVTDNAAQIINWVAVGRDITHRKAVVAQIQRLAFYDGLTQLPNRLVLTDRLEHAIRSTAHTRQCGALMFIDLDNFKTLNDTLGHSMGDTLLQQVAQRLTSAARPQDTVARLGGDEFVIMLTDLGASAGQAAVTAALAAEKILTALQEPYQLGGTEHHSSSSIGVTLFCTHEVTVSDLLKQADLAMYQAKVSGRNTVCFFDPSMQTAVSEAAALGSDLRQSLREKRFLLYYQPQVDRDGNMSGVEALLRWLHPQRGMVSPAEFIPAAEDSGLILPLGQWVLETACEQLAAWSLRTDTAHLCIAVNVSVRQFRHPHFVESVVAAINYAGIPASRLKLELTETLLADGIEVTVAKMATLKDMGVTLALDDFGVGYSALSSLKRLPLDQLKIDKNFVRDILRDPNDAAIARAIIAMAQSLGLEVMAEGVETEEQREFLAGQGCPCYQGYLFCPPLPIAELENFMQTRSR